MCHVDTVFALCAHPSQSTCCRPLVWQIFVAHARVFVVFCFDAWQIKRQQRVYRAWNLQRITAHRLRRRQQQRCSELISRWGEFVEARAVLHGHATTLQKYFRGHMAREAFHVMQEMQKQTEGVARRMMLRLLQAGMVRCFTAWRDHSRKVHRVKAMLRSQLRGMRDKTFELWKDHHQHCVDSKLKVALWGQGVVRGAKGRRRYRWLLKRWFAAMTLQRVVRSGVARFRFRKMLVVYRRRQRIIARFAQKVRLRGALAAFLALKTFAARMQRVRRLTDQALRGDFADRFDRWRGFWANCAASRTCVALFCQSYFRANRERMVAMTYMRRVRAARKLQVRRAVSTTCPLFQPPYGEPTHMYLSGPPFGSSSLESLHTPLC